MRTFPRGAEATAGNGGTLMRFGLQTLSHSYFGLQRIPTFSLLFLSLELVRIRKLRSRFDGDSQALHACMLHVLVLVQLHSYRC